MIYKKTAYLLPGTLKSLRKIFIISLSMSHIYCDILFLEKFNSIGKEKVHDEIN
jgi:hypothetical protein